ncbi:hypothetical protein [Nocardia sp. NPDC052566]|uniref:hypothetical protein n=1 Tax=Nocardia sp. NPDC052566 TaxID=3364330 RepID=UPI0037C72F5F
MTTRPLARFMCGMVLLLLAVATYHAGVSTYRGQLIDDGSMRLVSSWFGNDVPNRGILAEIQTPVLAVASAMLVLVLWWRRSLRHAGYAGLVVIGTIASAVLLKSALVRPSLGVGAGINSFPSNTAAAFAAIGCAFVVAVPRAARWWTGVAAMFGVGCVSVAVVALQWHRPSDVLGALLLAGAISMIGAALVFGDVRARSLSAATEYRRRDARKTREMMLT